MVKKRGLGKSLDALLAYTGSDATQSDNDITVANDAMQQMDVTQIQRGKYQPRREMDPASLDDLANSIRTQGIIQPIIVRPVDDKYEIIAGERRWRAAQLAGLTEVPVIVRHIPDEAAIAIALIENIQRENLNPIEEATALQRLIDEFGMTHQEAADAVGKNRATISNLLRLLVLPEEVRTMLERGQLEMGHARTLITLPEATQLEAANLIISRQLSVRETETLVRQLQAQETPTIAKSQKPVDPDIQNLQSSLARQLKMKVAIKCNAKGRGKLIIHYRNLTELDDLIAQFQMA
jgi:ParB family transcriptional regulator, chromosome partitioning protein